MLPFYEYRALVPADAIDAVRRKRVCITRAPRVAGGVPCVRTAPVIAPDTYFDLTAGYREIMGARVGPLARRLDALIVRTVFPEMTEDLLRLVITLDHDPGDACIWTDLDDLTSAFDRLEPLRDRLTAQDLGLRVIREPQAA